MKGKKKIIFSLMLVLIFASNKLLFLAEGAGIENGINSAVKEAQGLGVPLATLGLVIGGIMGIWGSFFGDGIGPVAKKIITGIGIGLCIIGGASAIATTAGGWFGLS